MLPANAWQPAEIGQEENLYGWHESTFGLADTLDSTSAWTCSDAGAGIDRHAPFSGLQKWQVICITHLQRFQQHIR